MSATIPDNKQLHDLLKPTGFNCPENLKDKTFYEVTSGSGESRTPQELNITANGNYNTPDGVYYDPISVNVPLSAVGVTMVGVQSSNFTTVGTPVTLSYKYAIGLDDTYVVWFGNRQINTRDIIAEQTYGYSMLINGLAFDITLLKQKIDGGNCRITVVYKDRGMIIKALNCFLVVGTFN